MADRMCWGCGNNVPDNEDTCPWCGDKAPLEAKCPICGGDMYPSDHGICRRCGWDAVRSRNTWAHAEEKENDDDGLSAYHEAPSPVSPAAEQADSAPAAGTEKVDAAVPAGSDGRLKGLYYGIRLTAAAGLLEGLVILFGNAYYPEPLRWLTLSVFVAVFFVIGSRILRSAAAYAEQRQSLFFRRSCFWLIILWLMLGYTAYSQGTYYAFRASSYDAAVACAQHNQWEQAKETLMPYQYETGAHRHYGDLYRYIEAEWLLSQKQYTDIRWKTSDWDNDALPQSLQAQGNVCKQRIAACDAYAYAAEKIASWKKRKDISTSEYEAIQRHIQACDESLLPEDLQPESQELRQEFAVLAAEWEQKQAEREQKRQMAETQRQQIRAQNAAAQQARSTKQTQ